MKRQNNRKTIIGKQFIEQQLLHICMYVCMCVYMYVQYCHLATIIFVWLNFPFAKLTW